MSKILLITTPCIELYKGLREIIPKYNPLGLAYLASFLEKKGIEVDIYDSFAEDSTWEDIERRIIDTDSNIIGVTSVTSTIREAVQIANLAKKYKKKVVIGGVHFTALPKETLEKYKCFDYGIVGEGELTLYELVSGKNLNEIDGIVYRQGNKVIVTKKRSLIKDLSIFPHPARHLLKSELYKPSDKMFLKSRKFYNIITARGCPFHCTFCASSVMWGNNVRFRSVEDIICELEALKNMGMQQLEIVDDTFTLNINRVKQISEKIKSLNIEWGCNARVNTVTREMLKVLKESNCIFIEYGIESGNQKILDIMKKGITLEQIRRAVKLTTDMGFKVSCSFIIGNIGETEETIKETLQLAKELNPDFAQFNILTPYPGTEVYRYAKEKGYLIKDFEEYTNPKYSDPVINLPDISTKRFKELSKIMYRGFYLNPKYIFKIMYNSLTSFYELKRNLKFLKAFMNVNRR